ncbi:hypothetical protein QFC24_004049 [Naganishia onofrii]|uniref:Uncharacterized protein n=1 Tax=Naganishia onofrii TaxID=1851511 RepID=A0ACC2XG37_9TREE|nr:hypothetical protein QFC24_004049 [Naganishia onofrii]
MSKRSNSTIQGLTLPLRLYVSFDYPPQSAWVQHLQNTTAWATGITISRKHVGGIPDEVTTDVASDIRNPANDVFFETDGSAFAALEGAAFKLDVHAAENWERGDERVKICDDPKPDHMHACPTCDAQGIRCLDLIMIDTQVRCDQCLDVPKTALTPEVRMLPASFLNFYHLVCFQTQKLADRYPEAFRLIPKCHARDAIDKRNWEEEGSGPVAVAPLDDIVQDLLGSLNNEPLTDFTVPGIELDSSSTNRTKQPSMLYTYWVDVTKVTQW